MEGTGVVGAPVTSSQVTSDGVTSSEGLSEEEIRQLKLSLVTLACSALQCDGDDLRQRLRDLSAAVAPHCPQFPLQVALYCRRQLCLRGVSCFLLAVAAILAPCRPHLRRYFGAVVRLPSDWLAVPRYFQALSPPPSVLSPYPRCLRDSLTRTFAAFDAHQLAKYRSRLHKGPRGHRFRRRRPTAPQRRITPQGSLPPSLFSLRSVVRRLHIREPRQYVDALLGRRTVTFDPRPRLPPPPTWERALSAGGVAKIPRAVTWQRLIESGQLPMLALLRNLRSALHAGLRPQTLQCVVGRLRDPEAVRRSQVPPSQWLRAAEALLEAGPQSVRSAHRVQWWRRRRRRAVRPPRQLLEALNGAALEAAAALPHIAAAPWIVVGAGGGRKVQEAMALVALLGRERAMGAELRLCGRGQTKAPPLPALGPMGLLGAVRALRREMEAMEEGGDVSDVVWELLESGRELSVLLLLCPTSPPPDLTEPLRFLRSRRPHSITFIVVTARPTPMPWEPRSDTFLLAGFNESVLRFVAEGDAATMLARVEAGPAHYGLAPPTAPPPARETALAPPLPLPVIGRWRTLRLFVSSTFADMAAERDAMVRAALPLLRAMAAPHAVGLSEVDLRWGVDHPDPRRQVELCLAEVARSDIIVGVLGERYGARAPNPPPQGFPPGRSVTELELRLFLQRWSSAPGPAPALIYIRDPAFLQAVPEGLRGIYGAESEEAAAKMAALKEELKGNPAVSAVRSYRCGWGPAGPTALQGFVAQVVADVWDVLQRHFLQGAPPSVQDSFLAAQLALGHISRTRLVTATAAAIRRGHRNRLVVTGEPGVGRTVFMAALIGALQQAPPPSASKPLPSCLVAYHFAAARPDQSDARVALAQLCVQLEELLGASHAPSGGSTYQELRPRLLALLATPPPKRRRLVVLIDDAHFLHVGGTECSDWLPPAVHPRVSLVLSAPADTSPAHFPEVGGACWTPLPLRPLPPPERADLLGAELRRWGRSFERRYVSAVLGKGGAKLPLYQRLLLAELRAFARYEDLPEVLLTAPPTVPALLLRILHRLADRHGPALALSLAALSAAPYGLEEAQALRLLGAEPRLGGGAKPTWEETLGALRCAPLGAPQWELLRDLRWLLEACGAPLDTPGSRLHLAGSRLAEAVRTFLGAGPKRRPAHGHASSGGRDVMATARRLLAGLTLLAADPLADGSFRGAELEHLSLLPRLLAEAELWEPLWGLMCGAGFLRAHVTHGAVGLLAHGARLLVPAQRCGAVPAVGLPSLLTTLDAAVGLTEELQSMGQEPLLPIEPTRSPTSVGQEEPLVGQEEALMGQKEPLMGQEESLVGLGEPLVGQKEPLMGLGEPLVGQKEPSVGQEPLMGREEPLMGQKEPLVGLGEPLVGQKEPLMGQEESLMGLGESRMGLEEPLVGQKEPPVRQEPLMGQEEPLMGQEESLMGLGESRMGLEEPLVGQKEPLVGQEEPLMGREESLMGLGEPLVGREALLVGLAQVVANSAPQCPLRPHSRSLLPHSGHRLLLGPTEDAVTHKWQRSVAVSPRSVCHWGPLVAVGGATGRVRLLEAAGGQEVQEVPSTCGGVTAVALLSSSLLAVGGAGGSVELWELRRGERLWTTVGHSGAVTALQCQNGDIVSAAMDGRIAVWSQSPSPPLRHWLLGAPLLALASHPQGALLAAAGWADRVVLLRRDREEHFRDLPSPRGRPISALCWDPDGTRLVATQVGGALLVWAWPEGDPLWAGSEEAPPLPELAPPLVLGYPGGHVTAVAFTPPTAEGEGPCVVTSGPGGKVLQWPSHRGRLHAELRAPSGDPEVGSGDPEVGSGDPEVGSRDPEVGSGDPEMGSADPEEGSREPGPALCVTFDPWGSRLAVGHHGGVCAVHGTPWGSAPRLCRSHGPITCLAWVGGAVLAGAGPDGALWGWELPGPAHLKPRPLWHRPMGRGAVLALVATANGIAVSTEDGAVLLFPLEAVLPHGAMEDGAVLLFPLEAVLPHGAMGQPGGLGGGGRVLYPHLGPTSALSFCPTETRLATGGRDRAVAVWGASGAAMGQQLQRWENAHKEWVCAVGWAGALLLSGSVDGAVVLWDVAVGQRLRELGGLRSPPCAVGGHGPSLVALSVCGCVWVWDRCGRPQIPHRIHRDGPTAACIAPPGAPRAVVAVTGRDGRTRVWHLNEWNAGDPMAMSPTPPSSAVPGAVVALGWDPEGTMVLAGGPGGQLTLWGDNGVMARGTCPPPQLWAVALLGAQCALVAAGRHLEEWELRGGRRLHRLRRHPALPRPIVGFCRGLRGGPVLILLGDGQLWLWDRGTPPKPLRAAVSPTPLDPKDLNRLYGADSGADGADGNGAAANGADGNGADDNGVAVTPYRLPGCPVAVQALPGGGFLLWGGMEKLHLCHLSRYGAAFRAAVTAVPLPPLPPHGPTQWFTGAEWHRDFGLFLTRSDGSMWVCPSWGRRDPHNHRWHRRKVSQQGALLGRLGAALLTAARDGTVRVWHPRGGAPLAHYRCSAPITAMAPRPRPSAHAAPGLAVGDEAGRVYILRWDTPTA